MIVVRKVLHMDGYDILNDTELKTMPDHGTLEIYAASSQNDTNITIFKNNEMVVFYRPIQHREAGRIDALSDTPFELEVSPGETVRVDIDINTAATVTVEAIFKRPDEI